MSFFRTDVPWPSLCTVLAAVFLGVFAFSTFRAELALAREDTLQEIEERKAWDEKRKKLREERRKKKGVQKRKTVHRLKRSGSPSSRKRSRCRRRFPISIPY